jgi:hypothetical protein
VVLKGAYTLLETRGLMVGMPLQRNQSWPKTPLDSDWLEWPLVEGQTQQTHATILIGLICLFETGSQNVTQANLELMIF